MMFIFAKLLNMIAAILDFAGKLWHGTVYLKIGFCFITNINVKCSVELMIFKI